MSRTLPLFLLVSSCAFSQQSSGKPPTTAALVENTPETVIAVVNGRNFTVGDLQKMLPSLPQQLKQLVATQPKTALEQYALGESLSREAEKLKLQDTSPYREELENVRRQVLSQAAIRQRASQIQIDPAEISKHYEANQADFRQAQVRIIFVSRGTFTQALSGAPTKPQDPEENKKKAETAAKLALAGSDFAELATKYSDDPSTAKNGGLLPYPIRASAQNFPQKMRDAILSAEPGAIVGPLEHETGWYLFRVNTVETPELPAVRAEIEKQMKDKMVRQWVSEIQTKSTVVLQNQPFWDTFIATNKPPEPAARPQGGSK